jgi:integrase/recombinase XerD
MANKRWYIEPQSEDLKLVVARYKKHLKDIGLRNATIEGYSSYLGRYLAFTGESYPPVSRAKEYREELLQGNLSRQTVNNACIAIKKFYKMLGEDYSFPYLSTNEVLPFFFDEDEVLKIFNAASCNIKHQAMLKILFYGGLRASEICTLEDHDIDFKTLSLKVRNGKGGKEGIVCLTEDAIMTLKKYIGIRPELEINGKKPIFYTDYQNLWDRRDVYRMFIHYKKKAGIKKPGGLHVFSRHSLATLLIKKGCDIRIIKDLLRHKDIQTTMRYAHVADSTKRAAYDKFLILA